MLSRFPIALGAVFALVGVMLGAFGAHALNEKLTASEMIDVWKTAVAYQMWHALALLFLGVLGPAIRIHASTICFALGILLFSGSLYWLSLGGPRWLGPITPLGGLLLIGGWGTLIASALRKSR